MLWILYLEMRFIRETRNFHGNYPYQKPFSILFWMCEDSWRRGGEGLGLTDWTAHDYQFYHLWWLRLRAYLKRNIAHSVTFIVVILSMLLLDTWYCIRRGKYIQWGILISYSEYNSNDIWFHQLSSFMYKSYRARSLGSWGSDYFFREGPEFGFPILRAEMFFWNKRRDLLTLNWDLLP